MTVLIARGPCEQYNQHLMSDKSELISKALANTGQLLILETLLEWGYFQFSWKVTVILRSHRAVYDLTTVPSLECQMTATLQEH